MEQYILPMKQINNKQILAAVMTISAGLMMTHSAQAQLISLSGISGTSVASAAGAGWVGSSGPTTFTQTPSGTEVQGTTANGYGYSYWNDGAVLLTPGDTQVTLQITINGSLTGYDWMGIPLTLNDGGPNEVFSGLYSAPGNPGNFPGTSWTGNTGSLTWQLNSAEITAINGGSEYLYGFNSGLNPATLPANYDITFNSLDFSAVPEPSTLAYSTVGAASILLFRRRK